MRIALPLAAAVALAACAGGPRPTGAYAPGLYRFVPDSAGPGRDRGCGLQTGEAFDVEPLDAAPTPSVALGDSAVAYAATLGRGLDDFLSGSDSGAMRRAVARLTVSAGGSVGEMRLTVASGDTSFDNGLLRRLRNAERIGVVRSLPIGLEQLRLAVGYGRRASTDEQLLVRSHVCPARPRTQSQMANFGALRHLGISTGLNGQTVYVLAQFVIDSAGRPAMATLEILRSPHPDLEPPVREILQASRYFPAERDGRKVPQLVQQPFGFQFP